MKEGSEKMEELLDREESWEILSSEESMDIAFINT